MLSSTFTGLLSVFWVIKFKKLFFFVVFSSEIVVNK